MGAFICPDIYFRVVSSEEMLTIMRTLLKRQFIRKTQYCGFRAFGVLRSYISLPLHSFRWIEPVFTVCLIRIYHLTLFVVYNYMMSWPLQRRSDPFSFHSDLQKDLHDLRSLRELGEQEYQEYLLILHCKKVII